MTTRDYRAVAEIIANNDKLLIIAHLRPDGDALGSSFGLKQIFDINNIDSTIFLPESFSDNYNAFAPEDILFEKCDIDNFSAIICLDTAASPRLGLPEGMTLEDITIPVINIDHHPDNKLFGSVNIVVPEAASTSEIVFDIAKQFNWKISNDVATSLMLGLTMDTGAFRFDNTNSSVMCTAAELLELGADYSNIIKKMFFSRTLPVLQLEAELMLNHVNMLCDNRFAWLRLDDELLAKHGATLKETEGLIDGIRSINGTEIVAILLQTSKGIKFSLRSKNPAYSVGKIARKLNGGGHEMAAGGIIADADFATAETIILKEVMEVLNG